LYPDINNSIDSEKDFIQITEAYDYLHHGEKHSVSKDVIYNSSRINVSEFEKTKFFDKTLTA
jgi:DnaJ-class molecular chaperone